jgi:hypothetical protein
MRDRDSREDLELVYLLVEGFAVDPEEFSGLGLIAAGFRQNGDDVVLLHFLEGLGLFGGYFSVGGDVPR